MTPSVPNVALYIQNQMRLIRSMDIMYCLSEGAYTQFFLANGEKVLIAKNLKEVENTLPNEKGQFFRIHRSCLINLAYATNYINNELNVVIIQDGKKLDVARSRRKAFLELFVRL